MLLGLLIGIPTFACFVIVAADSARNIYGRTHQFNLAPRWDGLVLKAFIGMCIGGVLMYLFLPQ
jgi:hypothetical protein